MNDLIAVRADLDELLYLKVAREIAMDIQPLETILTTHGIESSQWETMRNHPGFQRLLQSQIESWQSANNVHERVKIKAASLVEEFLPELNTRIHDSRESLNAKIEAVKLARDLAGMGRNSVDSAMVGEKFSVTINLGSDQSFMIEKDITSKVIEHEA